MLDKNISYAVYLRVSTDMQGEESLDRQELRCQQYADLNELVITKTIKDIKSGGTDQREGFQNLLTLIESGEIKGVLVYQLSRLTRSLKTLLEFIQLLNEKDIAFVSVKDKIDTSSPTGRMFLKLTGLLAEFEREQISERVKDSMYSMVKKAETSGTISDLWLAGEPPYHILRKKDDSGKNIFYFDEEKKEIIITIINRYIVGEPFSRLAKEFGISTTTLFNLLKNPILIGEFEYGKKRNNIVTNKTSSFTPHRYKLDVPHTIDKDTWNKLQSELESRGRSYTRAVKNPKFLLSSKVYCHCGKKMSVTTTKNKAYYICTKDPSHNFRVNRDHLESKVLNSLLANSWESFEIFNEKITLKEEIPNYNEGIFQSLLSEREKLISLFQKSLISEEEVEKKLEVLNKQIKSIEKTIIELKEYNSPSDLSYKDILIDLLQANDSEILKGFLSTFISKVQAINEFDFEIYLTI